MSDLDLDPQTSDRIRRALAAVADATPMDRPQLDLGADRRWQPLMSVAAAALIVVGLVTYMVSDRRDPGVVVETPPAGSPEESSPLPAGFDLETASPVFAAKGDADAVALAYLKARFPDYPNPQVALEPAVVEGDAARAAWTTGGPQEGVLASGHIHLRVVGDWWAVVAATTDEVDLSDVFYDGDRIQGTVRTTDENALFADVLAWNGEPVHRSPRPEGQPDAQYRFGTAGGPASGELALDVDHPKAPAVVRVHLVGGTLLSVSEVRFDPDPLEPHQDVERCVEEGTNREKEPTPDVVHRACVAALAGEVIASGVAGDRAWQLVASEEPTGTWITLRSRDQIGVFRVQSSGGFDGRSSEDVPFLSVGPCCAVGDFTAVAAAMHPDVDGIRVRLADGELFEGATATDVVSGVRYAVVLIPQSAVGEAEATVEVLDEGTWRATEGSVALAVLGG